MPPDPLILAFDTSAAHCAVALCRGGETLVSHIEEMGKGQAERLMPLLQETVSEAGLSFQNLDAIGCGIGPGNFTGIRISVSAARGFALALGVPAIGVSALEALAHGAPRPALALVDAKRDHVYAQSFGSAESAPARLPFETLKSETLPQNLTIIGHRASELGPNSRPETRPSAVAIAEIALSRLGKSNPPPAPLYLRGADAALPSDPSPRILDDP